ncbi:hypothetical protein CVCC1112_2905 [Paenarthrobacter nicotinovorans]|nr:hypothetical protein CVCC1112_2905 [Paenarthrobacter nicotinovorans]
MVNATVNIHYGCRNGVIVVVAEASRQGFCSINDTTISSKWFHN